MAIMAIYRFDAMFDTESGLLEKCKHSLAQLEYSWQFCKTNVSKKLRTTAVVIIIKGFMFHSSKRPILRGVGGTLIGLPRPYKLGSN